MAGIRMNVIPKRVFDFSNIAVGATQDLIVAERIDVSAYVDCMAALRVHSIDRSGGLLGFQLWLDGYSEDEPGRSFQNLIFGHLPIGTTAPFLMTLGGSGLGEFLAVHAFGNRTSAAPLVATVSLDLILRCPD
jgi:hypothetical protein